MQWSFKKYQGAGNDFILIDDRSVQFPMDQSTIVKLCNRRFGIGSDGLILIRNHSSLDFQMVFFNPDGSESLCGNGSRCAFVFARTLGMARDSARFETTDGIHEAHIDGPEVRFSLKDIQSLKTISDKEYYVNTGSPHFVRWVEDVEAIDVVRQGREIRYSSPYIGQNGTNVNFAQLLQNGVRVRTYERGVENETLSCGTGVTAVGLVASQKGLTSPVQVETRGGILNVFFEESNGSFSDIWLKGPAEFVFEGVIDL